MNQWHNPVGNNKFNMSVWKIKDGLFHYFIISINVYYKPSWNMNLDMQVFLFTFFKSVNRFCVLMIHVTKRSLIPASTLQGWKYAVFNTAASQDASCLHSSRLCWLCRSLLTSCILFCFGYVRWVDSCTIPFSHLSSSSVWEEEDPLRTIMSLCRCDFDLWGWCHFSWVSNTLLYMEALTWLHFYVHTVETCC